MERIFTSAALAIGMCCNFLKKNPSQATGQVIKRANEKQNPLSLSIWAIPFLILISVSQVFAASIIGPLQACPNTPVVYYAQPGSGESNYQFSVSGGTITGHGTTSQGYPSITVVWSSSYGTGTVYLTYYTFAYPSFKNISVQINRPPTVSPTMPGQSGCLYAPLQALSVSPGGTGPFTYQWYSNTTNTTSGGTLISGATGWSFTPPSSTAGTKYYYVVVSTSCGTASSVSGAVVVTPCNNYEALNFDGVKTYVAIPDPNGSLNFGTGPFTFEAYIKLTSGKERGIILSKRTFLDALGNTDGFLFGFIEGNPFIQIHNVTNIQPALHTYNLFDGNCHQVAVRRDNNYVISFFIDGVHVDDGDYTSNRDASSSVPGPLVIGSDLPTGYQACPTCVRPEFPGWIGEVRVWNYALSDTQIQSNLGLNLSPQTGLTAYYDMKDPVGSQTLSDLSTDGFNGTLGNSTSVDSYDPAWLTTDQVTCRVAGNFRQGTVQPTQYIASDSVKDISANTKLFPNPAQKFLTVVLPDGIKGSTPIIIYDMMGKETMRLSLEQGENTRVIDVGGLPNGLYIIRAKTPQITLQGKVMVSKE